MNRRRFLTLSGAGLTALAGCSTTGETSGTEDDVSIMSITPPEFEGTAEFRSLEPAVFEFGADGLYRLMQPTTPWWWEYEYGGVQYLFLDLRVTGEYTPDIGSFEFEFDRGPHEPLDPDQGGMRWATDPTLEATYDPAVGRESGWIVFELPASGDWSEPGLGYDNEEGTFWEPNDELRDRLSAPFPPLQIETWEVPETIALHERPAFTFSVQNEGELASRFSAAINARVIGDARPDVLLSHRIPADETREFTIVGAEIQPSSETPTDQIGDEEPDIEYELLWTGGSETRSVRIVE